jgi:hypothetical protein
MSSEQRDDLVQMARRIDAVATHIRRIHNDIGLPLSLSQALESLQRAEALVLEDAQAH